MDDKLKSVLIVGLVCAGVIAGVAADNVVSQGNNSTILNTTPQNTTDNQTTDDSTSNGTVSTQQVSDQGSQTTSTESASTGTTSDTSNTITASEAASIALNKLNIKGASVGSVAPITGGYYVTLVKNGVPVAYATVNSNGMFLGASGISESVG